jgi:hypothetical protein
MSPNALLNVFESAKWTFVCAYILSTIGVTIGVYWEGDQFDKAKQHRGWILLICCLAADTFFTIMVFGIEGWVGHIQRNEIIALESRLAARTLTPKQQRAIADAIRQYSGIKFELGTYTHVPECAALTDQIGSALKNANWELQPVNGEPFSVLAGVVVTANAYVCNGTGMQCSPDTPPQEDEAAEALVNALRAAGIDAAHAPKQSLQVNPTRIAVAVYVGIKP